jgi:uncharacterized delta-60 repeat protein
MKSLLFILVIFFSLKGLAQIPDPGFGTDGKAFQSFGNFHAELTASCLQFNGKIFSVGNHGLLPNKVLVCRHNQDGTPDTGFGDGGVKELVFGTSTGYAYTCLQATNTSLFVAGTSDGKATMHFLNPDGSYNVSFGTGGKFLIDFGPGNGARIDKLLTYPNGTLLGIGSAYNGNDWDFMVVRVYPGGELDPTFANGGKAVINVGGFNDFAMDGDFQSDGNIVLSGYSNNNSGLSQFSAIRLTPDGDLDVSFGNNGKWIFSLGNNYNNIEGLAIQSDDKILLGGYKDDDMITFRLNANGTPDNGFHGTGYVITDFNGLSERAFDIEVQGDGKILTAGWITTSSGTNQYAICRHTSQGFPDHSFNGNGQHTIEMGAGNSWINQILMQYDNKLLLCGLAVPTLGGFSQFSLLQLTELTLSDKMPDLMHQQSLIYPNPAGSMIHITESVNGSKYKSVRIFDLSGRLILEKAYTGNPLNIVMLPSGAYKLQIFTEDYKVITSGLIKK